MLNLNTNPGSRAKSNELIAEEDNYINVKLYNRDSDLLVIHEAAKLIGRSTSPDYPISAMLRMMSQVLGLNRGRVLLPQGDQIKIRYSYGLTTREHNRGVYLSGEGITGKVMTSGQLVVIENIDQEPGLLFRAVERKTLPQEVVSYIALPIMDGDTPIGVLACHRIRDRLRPFDADLVILRTFATLIGQTLKINRLLNDSAGPGNHASNAEPATEQTPSSAPIIGQSEAMRAALELVEQVAEVDATVLLTGESGTGKENFARLIHQSSLRQSGPLVAINCAAIPEQLLEAELFGHERGAFTGAVAKKIGKFELADGGTLFLDEIGDLSPDLQTKLLRVLETRSVQRVGGNKEIPVDVRIVAATHKNLMAAVNAGQFRLDLFYRLNVFPIQLPALRCRQGDVSLLAQYFLEQAQLEYRRTVVLEKGALDRLNCYEWPGNVRQLENIIKRAILMSKRGVITGAIVDNILASESQVRVCPFLGSAESDSQCTKQPAAVDEPALPIQPASGVNRTSPGEYPTADALSRRSYNWVDKTEEEEIKLALQQARGNKTRAAALLGMTARQLRYRLNKLGITDPQH